jgi:hypothetical protein
MSARHPEPDLRSSPSFSASLGARLTPALGWALAVAAIAAGYASWGGQGVALAITVIVFWLLLQFSRALRVLRVAGQNPVGRVANAVMFASRLEPGMKLPQLLVHSKSLGTQLSAEPEVWAWVDEAGDRVLAEFGAGRLRAHRLERAGAISPAGGDGGR